MGKQMGSGNARRLSIGLRGWAEREVRLWPVAAALAVVLFPFDWLGDVWPLFGQVLAAVFATARDHAIGHATMFFLLGVLLLLSLPRLRPLFYTGGMLLVALGQEALQDLFRQLPPNIWELRDMFFDVTGALAALGVIWLWRLVRRKMTAPAQ